MKSVTRSLKDEHQKNIVKIFDSLAYRHSRWTVWSDFVTMAAISISNAVDKTNAESREATYHALEKRYNNQERESIAQMFHETVMAMEANPDQDFLGELFMALDMSNEHNGQFFTPYSVCRMMAQITGTDIGDRIERNGWISTNDPACGAGALLLAFANECTRQHINFQDSVLFVAQDIDFVVGCMCYIQMSLLGCPGYVVIADTIRNPGTSYDGRGLLPVSGENVWFTPLYFTSVWHYRRVWAQMDTLFKFAPAAPQGKAEQPAPEPLGTVRQPEQPIHEQEDGQLMMF